MHLHTPITAALGPQQPLAAGLHPTPAVAVLRSLEPFDRGFYAAPTGWIDSEGDTEMRVAIRSGTLQSRRLELAAGLVQGSNPEWKLQEVALKLGVLWQLLSLPAANARNSARQPRNHLIGQRNPAQPLHLPDAGGAGHVDLAEAPVNYIDAHVA